MADILVVDDDHASRAAIVEVLERDGHRVASASSGREGLERIRQGAGHPAAGAQPSGAAEFDLVVTDLVMPDVDGMAILEAARSAGREIEVIIMTGYGSVESAVEAMKNGAYQYLNKPVNIKELREVARKALEKQTLARDNVELRKLIDQRFGFESILGNSQPMVDLFARIRQIAPTSATVLISGASGTGKELIAHAIHNNSPRKNKPFLAFNCGALTESLIESELFGHEKGSFTGAVADRKGYFELANGGTLLLDEIGEMPLHTQVKLLRVIETRSFFRVGSARKIDIDVRVLGATNRDLEERIKEGAFREDLYYRLNVLSLVVPPLKKRREDIPLFVKTFIDEFNLRHGKNISGCSQDVLDALMRYDWPGNVRELRNLMENLVITSTGPTIEASALPPNFMPAAGQTIGVLSFEDGMTMDQIEREVIRIALDRTGGNKKKAAERLGMSLRTFHRKVKSDLRS